MRSPIIEYNITFTSVKTNLSFAGTDRDCLAKEPQKTWDPHHNNKICLSLIFVSKLHVEYIVLKINLRTGNGIFYV